MCSTTLSQPLFFYYVPDIVKFTLLGTEHFCILIHIIGGWWKVAGGA
jgi:hypothetical protein